MIVYQHGIRDSDGDMMFCPDDIHCRATHGFYPTSAAAYAAASRCWPDGQVIVRARYVSSWMVITNTEFDKYPGRLTAALLMDGD